ncbi:hypothetical protein NliqN6_1939 [Naganishia liquefaciens]|uniref:Histidine phosphatase family protein n=1 Tax=Naganishia liquefaciens TaxID=104408 RepID=A0A8H3TQV8_9TREE|nr:hypothetical protein NliqN6_1939 [Naganishia liquefaciens]
MAIPATEAAQVPSNPNETSASKAFTQLPPHIQAAIAEYKATSKGWTPDYKPGGADEKIRAAFAAYATHDEPDDYDESKGTWRFEIAQGLFRQSDEASHKLTPEQMLQTGFGLLDETPERWTKFKEAVAKLQKEAPQNVKYKVLFCGRHGQGWHNYGAEQYDPVSWELDYTKRNGDGKIVWGPDAELTPLGQSQALAVQEGWKRNLALGAPMPETWLCSPLTRTADTMRLSFGDILDDKQPIFVEALREIYGEHTCDMRRSKSYLQERFPTYGFEPEFAEEDPWWKPDERETELNRRERLRNAMFQLFSENDNTYISITSHSCALRSLLTVLRHRPYSLGTGEMIPVIVKATKQN